MILSIGKKVDYHLFPLVINKIGSSDFVVHKLSYFFILNE